MKRVSKVSVSGNSVKPNPKPAPKDTRFAVLIGINYKGTDNELSGCINDVLDVKNMLITKFGYLEQNITLMSDDTNIKPTCFQIMKVLRELVVKTKKGECTEFWFHYSGHGSSTPDNNGDEVDKQDEVIIPLDFQSKGVISDDMIHAELMNIPESCKGLLVFDSCMSGTVSDLPYVYDGENLRIDNSNKNITGNIMSISGCRDDEFSADANINNKWGGALTQHMLQIIKDHDYAIGCFKLIRDIRAKLQENGYTQYPILSSSKTLSPSQLFCTCSTKPFIQMN